jgi:four helix bundle protein
MHNYKELKVWQKAVDFSIEIYKTTTVFPDAEKFNLISQIRRCVVLILSNIAEGAGRNTQGEFKHFIGIAQGSAFEIETQLIISEKLKLINKNEFEKLLEQINHIQKMLNSLNNTLK